MGNNRIKYNIDFEVNQSQLMQVKTELQQLQRLTVADLSVNNPGMGLEKAQEQVKEIHKSAQQLEQAFNKAFNTHLGSLNLKTLNKELKNLNLKEINTQLSTAGATGIQAFQKMTSSILGTNLQLKQSHKLLDSMATTMVNTAKWGVTSRIFNEMASSVQKAWTFTKELDTSLNDIRIVTGKSADEMERFARTANNVAQTLGKSTKDFTDASLIYYQQGLNDVEAQARAEVTLKAANVTGQSTDTVSEQLTAVWNGYKVAIEDSEMYVDKLAAVAADTAADLEELSTGMSKVASAANIMGVDIDQLSATLATVISVTRQAPESVGTAFKTIYARMGDIQAGIDTETSLDAYTQDMLDIGGINVLDTNNELRDMGEVIEEVGEKWSSMTREQQIALSQVMAGTRQYNNLLSLFDNWDMYTDALETSRNSLGTLDEQQSIYMESTEAHLEQLSTAWERVFDAMVDNEGINNIIDMLTGATTGIANFIEALGGGGNALLTFGAIATQVFSKQIASSINISIQNLTAEKRNIEEIESRIIALQTLMQTANTPDKAVHVRSIGLQVEQLNILKDNLKGLNNEQIQQISQIIDKYGQLESQVDIVNAKVKQAKDFLKSGYEDFAAESTRENFVNTGKSQYKNNLGATIDNKQLLNTISADKRELDGYIAGVKQLENSILAYQKAAGGTAVKTKAAEQAFANMRTVVSKASEDWRIFGTATEESRKQLENALKPLEGKGFENFFNSSNNAEKLRNQFENFINIYKNLLNEVKGQYENLDEILASGGGTAWLQNVQKQAGDTKTALNDIWDEQKQQQLTQGFVKLSGAIMNTVSALQTLSNLDDIWNDEDLTTGEKTLQILSSLTMGVGQLVNAGAIYSEQLPIVTGKIKEFAFSQLSTASAAKVGSAANMTFGTTLKGVAAGLSSTLVAILPYAIAIGALVAVIYGLVKAYNADAEAAQRANEAAEKLNERYNELKTSAEEFKKTISEYEDGIKALDELERHTDEYKTALEEANEKARELIETYELWDDYTIKNGLIVIDPDALEEAKEKSTRQVSNAESTAYGANIAASQANLKLSRTELSRDIGALQKSEYMVKKAGGFTRYVEGTTHEAGERMTESNQLSDASIQQIIEGLNKLRDEDPEQYALTVANEEMLKNAILEIDGVSKATKENIDQILKQKDALIKLTEETYKQADAASYYTSQIMQNEVEEKYGSQLEEMAKDEEGNVDQSRYNQLLAITANNKEQQEQMEKDLKNLDLSKSYTSNNDLNKNYSYNIGNDEDLARTYAKEVLGYTQEEIDKMDYDGHIGAGTLKLANGDKVLDKYSDEQMREQLARQKRTNEITEKYAGQIDEQKQIDALNKLMSGAESAGAKYGTDFTDALLNSLTAENHEIDLSGLFAEIDPSEYNEIVAMTDQEILDMVGMDEETLKNAGYASAKEFITNFRAGLNNYEWDVDKALDAAVGKRDDNYEEMDLDTEDVKDYAKHLMEVSEKSEELADSLETSADAGALVAEYVIRMNKGIEELAENIDDWEDVLKKSSETSEEYSDAMDGIQDALSNVLGVEADFISNSYVTDHLADIEKAAEGDAEAIDRLKDALAEDIVLKVMAEGEVDINTQYNVLNKIEELQNQIPNIKVGTEIEMDDATYAQFFQDMQDIVAQAGLTAEQANALFSTMGFEAEFATESQPVKKTGRGTRTVTEFMDETTVNMPDGSTMNIPSGWETKTYPGEPYEYVDYVDAIAMSTDGKTPKINKLTKKGSSSMNNYSSSNKGGGSAKKSSGSKKDPNKMDKVDKTPDRYHKVNTQLTKIGNQLDKIQSQEKKFIGAELIANINGQLDQLDDRLDNLREKEQIAYGEMDELRQKLAGQGVQFNDDGTVANYMEIYESKVAYVNGLIDKYNAMSAEEQEAYKETVEQAKEDLDKFTEELDRYDELVSDFIPGIQQEIQDAIDEQIELNIKKFNMEFDVRLNMKEATKDWNEFKKTILDGIKEDDIYGNAAARVNDDFTNMIGENGVQASTKQAEEVLAELKEMDATGWSDVYGDDRVKALEDLKTAYETINEDLMEIDQIQKDVHQAWLDTMDEINEKMADQVSMYEQISNLIEHDMKVIELVYGETDYEALGKYFEKQHQNNLGLLDFQRQNAEFWENEMNSIDKEADPDAWKIARDNWISAVNDLNATIEASIENARDKMENAIDDVFDKFNDQITDGKGLDYLAQQWDLVNDVADDYLDTVNTAFGIRQLESKYQDAIDATDNVSAQRKLNALMEEELKALREKDKLTEYDIERANMKYEIALKQIALEEAQQTKTTMRLRRDSQGNYRYEYIADEDEIAKLQDELEILENELYNFDKERWIEMQNQVVDAVQERQDAIKEILMDASLSEEERAERLAEINRLYNEKIQNITDQTVTAQNNLYQSGADELSKIWDEQGQDFADLSAEEQRILTEEMLPQFETGVNEMIDKFSGPGGFEEMTTGSMDALSQVTQDYNQDLQDIEQNAGIAFDEVEDGVDKNIPKTEQLIEDNDALNAEYEEQIQRIKDLNTQLDNQIKKYQGIADAAKQATQEAYKYWQEQQRQAAEAAEKEKQKSSGSSNNTNNNSSNNTTTNTTSSGGSSGGDGNPTVGETVTYIGGTYYYDSNGTSPSGSRGPGRKVKITAINNGARYPIHVQSTDSAYGWLRKDQLSGYDTGGYTGDWVGDYGKLAMLHSKELVLNAHDTENMLDMMQIARDVIASSGPRVGALNAGRGADAATTQLEQNVHIEANFPNVESASEIEEALNNLVQLASQRATRNTRG